jgi:hypothetical protein
MACKNCFPIGNTVNEGSYTWGSYITNFVPGQTYQIGDCEDIDGDSSCDDPVDPQCQIAINGTVTIGAGYYMLDYGAGLPVYNSHNVVIMANGCGQQDGWYGDIYDNRSGTPIFVIRLSASVRCTNCQ